jgi:peptidoglycan L-alanyl-D-glutamate endopeptidase CwlK
MPHFGPDSREHLRTCDERLVRVLNEVVKRFDCSVICGYRGQADQEKAYQTKHSMRQWPDSTHNRNPSPGVDAVPYPVDWNDTRRFYLFAGYVLRTAHEMGIELRWGGDWDDDLEVKDNNFNDLAHFELAQED